MSAPIVELEDTLREHPRVLSRFLAGYPGYAARLLDSAAHPDQELIDSLAKEDAK